MGFDESDSADRTESAETGGLDRETLLKAIEISTHAIIICDLSLAIEWVNSEFLRKFDLEDIRTARGLSVLSLLVNPEAIEAPMRELTETGRWQGELQLQRLDGSIIDTLLTATIIPDDSGKPLKIIASGIDITEERKTEAALADKTMLLDSILHSASDVAIATTDLDLRITYYNPMAEEFFGYKQEEVIGQTVMDMHMKEKVDPERLERAIETVRRTGEYCYSITQETENGPRYLDSRVSGIFNSDADLVGFSLFSRDVTERECNQEALRASEEMLDLVIDNIPQSVFWKDRDSVFLGCNRSLADTLGLDDPKEIRGKTDYDLCVTKEEADSYREIDRRIMEADQPEMHIIEHLHDTDGTDRWLDTSKTPLHDASGEVMGILATFEDITERRRAEEALQRSESELRTLFNSMTDIVFEMDYDGRYINIAPTSPELMVKPRDDVLGKTLHEVFPKPEADRFLAFIRKSLDSREVVSIEYPLLIGDRTYWFEGRATPKTENTVLYIARDITERKLLGVQLRQAQKMEAVGQLAGGIAHDFNNLLQVINGYAELALADIDPSHPAHTSIREVEEGGNRAKALVNQLLAFSRRQILDPVELDLNDVISNLMKMIHRVIGEHIICDFIPGHELGIVSADRGQMEQVLMNLCINARDAMPDGGHITIETANVLIDGNYIRTHPWAKPGRFVLLSVTDTGAGMDEVTLENVFDPFFTTKEVGKGTGLGLSTVYGIVKQHEGEIQVYSEVGKGSMFKIYMPSVEHRATEVSSSVPGATIGGTEMILIAEDDDSVRILTEQMLERAGYSVLSAEDGEEAVRLFKAHAGEISLALLDVVMPGLGGKQVHDRIKMIKPGVLVLFSSGYSHNAIHTSFVLDEGLQLIQKPYGPDDLLRRVRKVLDT